MYLSSINLKNFRSFKDGVVSFNQYLTTLVGENNSGKSNIIDAIRLLTLPLNDRRDRYCEEEDVRVGAEPQQFTLNATYNGLTPGQKGLLVTALLDPTQDAAVFGVTFKPATQLKPRGDVKYWAGKHNMEPESGSTDLIRHVYLPPLRDAQRVLASGNPTRILSLLRHFIGDDSKEQQLVKDLARTTDNNETLTTVNTTVGNFLNELTTGVRPQTTRLGFSENEKLGDIARDLRFKLSDHGISPEDLTHSGLGFSNLLFMATILVELEKAQEADLTLLLVEEPEAHLHPQLQSAVLGFLLEQAQKSQNKEIIPGKPEGRIQVIVTTHSPNMASGVAPGHLTVVRSIQQDGDERRQSVSIPVSQLQIPPKDLAKIERYIDVTKSSLLFGQRCLLVEGIAEALLLPAIARRYVFNGQDDASRKKLRQFNATALIPIDGVDFEPYLKVLLSKYKDNTICDLVVIVTDGDPDVPGNRKTKLEQLAQELEARDKLQVFTNAHTLEAELFSQHNEALLKSVYLACHPNSGAKWANNVEPLPQAEKPAALVKLMDDSRTRKGDFAQNLVAAFDSDATQASFQPPEYLVNAIKAVVGE